MIRYVACRISRVLRLEWFKRDECLNRAIFWRATRLEETTRRERGKLRKRDVEYEKHQYCPRKFEGQNQEPPQIRAQVEIQPQNNRASYTGSWRAPNGMPPQIKLVSNAILTGKRHALKMLGEYLVLVQWGIFNHRGN